MKSLATRRFWDLFHNLPPEIQMLATKSYHRWRQNPSHPSLHFHRLKGSESRFSVRVGDHYRALGISSPGTITWVWIGTHSDYNQLVRSD